MQQTTSVAVLATHLARTDRRALSQAWYDALHLADHAPPPRARLPAATSAASRGTRTAARPDANGPLAERVDSRAATTNAPAARNAAGANAANAATAANATATSAVNASSSQARCGARAGSPEHGDSAARIDHATVRRPAQPGAASFTVQAPDGRVHLVVRSDGARTRVVAVCAPPLRERVERVLAHVRFTLAGAGVRAEAA